MRRLHLPVRFTLLQSSAAGFFNWKCVWSAALVLKLMPAAIPQQCSGCHAQTWSLSLRQLWPDHHVSDQIAWCSWFQIVESALCRTRPTPSGPSAPEVLTASSLMAAERVFACLTPF